MISCHLHLDMMNGDVEDVNYYCFKYININLTIKENVTCIMIRFHVGYFSGGRMNRH